MLLALKAMVLLYWKMDTSPKAQENQSPLPSFDTWEVPRSHSQIQTKQTKPFHNNTQSKQAKSKHLIINTPFAKWNSWNGKE